MRCVAVIVGIVVFVGCSEPSVRKPVMSDSMRKSIEDFNNRKIYRTLDVETLRGIPDDELEQAIVDYVVGKLEANADEDAVLKSLSEGNRALWLTWAVEAEVNNGGFSQYYFNSAGKQASEAAAAFDFFAAPEHAALMREANAVRQKEAAGMREHEAEHTLESFSESREVSKLGPLDDRFYALKEDLSALRIAKIRQSPELFLGE
jgi:hypothetical protein